MSAAEGLPAPGPSDGPSAPFGARSAALGLHVPVRTSAEAMVASIRRQSRVAEAAGFHGATISEHHLAFPGYMAQPLLACNWILAETDRLWAAACPTVLPLWNPAVLAEHLAWTAAAYPGRVGLGVVAGYYPDDFAALGADFDSRVEDFVNGIGRLHAALSAGGPLAADPAIAALTRRRAPLVSGVNSRTAARRAADSELGIIVNGHSAPNVLDALIGTFRDSGGDGPVVLIVRAWVGAVPDDALRELLHSYDAAGAPGARSGANERLPIVSGTPGGVVDEVGHLLHDHGATSLNVRVHLPGVEPRMIEDQIEALGGLVLPHLTYGR